MLLAIVLDTCFVTRQWPKVVVQKWDLAMAPHTDEMGNPVAQSAAFNRTDDITSLGCR